MPFINGRYHVNPTMGAALEAAREAEAALLASQDQAHRDNSDSPDASAPDASATPAQIHRVEIEAGELLPPRSVRATSGFVARIHRSQPQSSGNSSPSPAPAAKPETHVFSNHADLLNFLHDELSKR